MSVGIFCSTLRGCDSKNNKGGNKGWEVRVSGVGGKFVTVDNAGDRAGSSALYAGLASSRPGNSAHGRVSHLSWTIGGYYNFPRPQGWFFSPDRFTPVITATGKGRARWEKKFASLTNEL